jgi:AraC-like DNA-binding protein
MLDVCVDCGFSDYRYFTRAFRQYLGMTPEEYARRGQSANSSANIAHAPYPGEHIFTSEESLNYLMKFET